MASAHSAAWVIARLAQTGESTELVHEGHSMAPCLRPGDVLLVAPLKTTLRTQPGAIFVALRGDRLVAHRLVRWTYEGVVLRGDANRTTDGELRASAIVGEVVSATRGGRTLPLTRTRAQAALALARALVPAWIRA